MASGSNDLLARLERWYRANCDGNWEHEHGVKIDTLDNPGWSITIEFVGTASEGSYFAAVKYERAEDDWIQAWVDDNTWHAACGPLNLSEALKIFLDWTDSPGVYTCPVCGYPELTERPYGPRDEVSYEICYSCGFEFGVSDLDKGYTHAAWREKWIDEGTPWRGRSRRPPEGWDPRSQLKNLDSRDD